LRRRIATRGVHTRTPQRVQPPELRHPAPAARRPGDVSRAEPISGAAILLTSPSRAARSAAADRAGNGDEPHSVASNSPAPQRRPARPARCGPAPGRSASRSASRYAGRRSCSNPDRVARPLVGHGYSNAPDGAEQQRTFRVTHPFHPLLGREFELLEYSRWGGEARVFYRDGGEQTRSLPASWTSAAADDPFVGIAAGRSPLRVVDLLRLVQLVRADTDEADQQHDDA